MQVQMILLLIMQYQWGTEIIRFNVKNISLMKQQQYTLKDFAIALFFTQVRELVKQLLQNILSFGVLWQEAVTFKQ